MDYFNIIVTEKPKVIYNSASTRYDYIYREFPEEYKYPYAIYLCIKLCNLLF